LSTDNPVMSNCISQRATAINRCEREKCKYVKICYGGCPYGSYLNGKQDISQRDLLCAGKKALFKYIEDKLSDNGVMTMNNHTKGDTNEGEKRRRSGDARCEEGVAHKRGCHEGTAGISK